MSGKPQFITNCTYNGMRLFCSDADTATVISNNYDATGKPGMVFADDNMVGGTITNGAKLIANLQQTYAGEQFEFRAVHAQAPATESAPEPQIVESTTVEELPALCANWDLSKKMAGMLWLYSVRYAEFIDGHTSVGAVQNVFELDHTNISRILKANKQLVVGTLTDSDKVALQGVTLKNMLSGFTTVHEVVTIFSPPGFLYWCLGYGDFTVYYLKDAGFIVYFGTDFLYLDHNYGFVRKSSTFDHKLASYNKRIDYWDAALAADIYTFSKFLDVPKMKDNKVEIQFSLEMPGKQYSGLAVPDTFKQAMNLLMMPKKISAKVDIPLEWDADSRESLALAAYVRRFPNAPQIAVQAEASFLGITRGIARYFSFAKVDSYLLGLPQKITGKDSSQLSVLEFIDSTIMLDTVLAFSTRILKDWINPADKFEGYPVVSYGQWVRILDQGRALRKKLPNADIYKEYGVVYGFPQEIQGASTSRKGAKRLEILNEVYPDCMECDALHYVGITSTDNMLGNIYEFWLERWDGVKTFANASFTGFDVNPIGKNILTVGEDFQMVQDVNFFTKAFEHLLASEYAAHKKYMLFSDAYIVHARDSTSFVRANPFRNADPPAGWPRLIDLTLHDGYTTATDEERSLFNYFSWCAAKYHCGVVKFHLIENVSYAFWEILAARFRKMNREFFIWKSGRIHNLEFDFFFGPLPEDGEDIAITVTEKAQDAPSTIPPPGGAPPVETGFLSAIIPQAQAQAPPPAPPPPSPSMVTLSTKPRTVDGVKDRFLGKRHLILVYWVQMAVYCEIHRTFSWMNPLVTLSADEVSALGKDFRKRNVMATKGYRDVSFFPTPVISTVTIGQDTLFAIRAAKTGVKKLDKGISAALKADDSFVVAAKLRESELEKLDFSDVTPEQDNKAPVPRVAPEAFTGRYRRRKTKKALKPPTPPASAK